VVLGESRSSAEDLSPVSVGPCYLSPGMGSPDQADATDALA